MPDSRTTVFGQRPWLNKEGREIANKAARRMSKQEDTASGQITLGDVLNYLAADGPKSLEDGLITDLLAEGLNYQEAIYWYLWKYCGLTPKEIHLAETGREHVNDWDNEGAAVRTVEATLTVAGRKRGRKGHISDWDRDADSDQSDAV